MGIIDAAKTEVKESREVTFMSVVSDHSGAQASRS